MNTQPDQNQPPTDPNANISVPNVSVPMPRYVADLASILGLLLSFVLIAFAIYMGQSNANFFNVPSLLIVFFGTITATCISYTGEELLKSGAVLGNSVMRPARNFKALAKAMMDISTVGRKRGILALSAYEREISKEPFLKKAIQLAVDGFNEGDIKRILEVEIDAELERNKRAASMLRRASEIAPAMGLIGTLVGLVQMLADLENPETIGPAMAVALLTTFYGAIMGTVVLSPLSAKLEKNALDESLVKILSLKTALSIVRQENPRSLEMQINSELPPEHRIVYFD